jgi:hypothetical protein
VPRAGGWPIVSRRPRRRWSCCRTAAAGWPGAADGGDGGGARWAGALQRFVHISARPCTGTLPWLRSSPVARSQIVLIAGGVDRPQGWAALAKPKAKSTVKVVAHPQGGGGGKSKGMAQEPPGTYVQIGKGIGGGGGGGGSYQAPPSARAAREAWVEVPSKGKSKGKGKSQAAQQRKHKGRVGSGSDMTSSHQQLQPAPQPSPAATAASSSEDASDDEFADVQETELPAQPSSSSSSQPPSWGGALAEQEQEQRRQQDEAHRAQQEAERLEESKGAAAEKNRRLCAPSPLINAAISMGGATRQLYGPKYCALAVSLVHACTSSACLPACLPASGWQACAQLWPPEGSARRRSHSACLGWRRACRCPS